MTYFPTSNVGKKAWLFQALIGPFAFVMLRSSIALLVPEGGLALLPYFVVFLVPVAALVPFPISLIFLIGQRAIDILPSIPDDAIVVLAILCYLAAGPHFGALVETVASSEFTRAQRSIALAALFMGVPALFALGPWLLQIANDLHSPL